MIGASQRSVFGQALLLALAVAPITVLPGKAHAQEIGQDAADAVTIPFAPPLGTPMRYRIVQDQPAADGTMLSFRRSYDMAFEKIGRAYRLTVTLTTIESDAPEVISRAFKASLQPLQGLAVHYRISPDGATIYLEDPATVRVALDAVLVEIMRNGKAGGDEAIATAAVQRFAKLDDAELTQLLFGDVRPVLQFSGGHVATGPSGFAHRGEDDVAGKRTAETRLTVKPQDAVVHVGERTVTNVVMKETGQTGDVVSTIAYVVDRSTGLTTHVVERKTVGEDPEKIIVTKTGTLAVQGSSGN